jgi:hypothetical protein
MRLSLENWLDTQNPTLEAMSCFNESFTCYRAGGCKAALLFAYLGFMHVIRDRVLASPCPTGMADGQWTATQSRMRSAETWDREAFDTTQQKNPAPIFIVLDNLRKQVDFWKDRRNDCAHSKDNKITQAYVETIYAFIESNLNKFVVNGSRTEMMRRIMEHFDPSITPPGISIEPIIIDIPNTVLAAELIEFIRETAERFDAERGPIEVMLGRGSENKVCFFDGCFRYGDQALVEVCASHLFLDNAFLLTFFRARPDRVAILRGHPEKIRRLWHEHLFAGTEDDFPPLASLIRLGLLPEEQSEEAFRHMIRRGTAHLPNNIDNVILEARGFYTQLKYILVDEHLLSDFDWANNTKGLIIKFLAEHPISVDVAREIYLNFRGPHYAWHAANVLNDFFRTNAAKKAEYSAFIDIEDGIGRPGAIPSLSEGP